MFWTGLSILTATAAPVDKTTMTRNYPEDIGILAIETYFPRSYVLQTDLGMSIDDLPSYEVRIEKFDGVSAEKYTVGLGQKALSFVHENEDVVSMSMTGKPCSPY